MQYDARRRAVAAAIVAEDVLAEDHDVELEVGDLFRARAEPGDLRVPAPAAMLERAVFRVFGVAAEPAELSRGEREPVSWGRV